MMDNFYTSVEVIGNSVCVRGVRDGKRVSYKDDNFLPKMFLANPSIKNATYRNMRGVPLEEVSGIDSIYDFKQKKKDLADIEGLTVYGQEDPVDQYIEEHFRDCQYDFNRIRFGIIDIEVDSSEGFPDIDEALMPITAISYYDSITKKYKVFGTGEYQSKENEIYTQAENEKNLLYLFVKEFSSGYPDVLSGWNCEFFDIPYLFNRITRLFGEKAARSLSPWNKYYIKKIRKNWGKEQTKIVLKGITTLDYLDLYQKYTYTARPSYRLGYIAQAELGDDKVDYSDYGTLHNLYKKNHQLFIEYNIKDVDIIVRLNEKMKLFEQHISLAYLSGVNYGQAYSPVKSWDVYVCNNMIRNGVVPKFGKRGFKDKQIVGAYVKDPQIGLHNWCASFDATSLYPSIMMAANISPETLIQQDTATVSIPGMLEKREDIQSIVRQNKSVCANGAVYTQERDGIFKILVQKVFNDRKATKERMLDLKSQAETAENKDELLNEAKILDIKQQALKIHLNSLYGAATNPYFRFFDVLHGEAITMTGQVIIQTAEKAMNDYLNGILNTDKDYVIAIDTDSIIVRLDELVQVSFAKSSNSTIKNTLSAKSEVIDFIDKACQTKFEHVIQEAMDSLSEYMGFEKGIINFKREVIADKAVWTAKKRYIMNVYDSEGVRFQTPNMKIMGLEAKKSSTPEVCQKALVECYRIIMEKDESALIKFVDKFKEVFKTLPIEEISFPISCSKVEEYEDPKLLYKSRTPINSKAAIIHNHLIRKSGLHTKYDLIKAGDKIMYALLYKHNPIMQDVIGFIDNLPEEFGLDKYVDVNRHFEKGFLSALEPLLEAIGWNHEKQYTFDSLIDFE